MEKPRLTNFEIATFVFFIMRSFFLGLAMEELFKIAKQDSYLSIILGTILGIIFLSLNKFKGKKSLPKYPNIVGILITTLIFGVIFYHFIAFIQIGYLDNTPFYIIGILFILAITYFLHHGIKIIGRVSSILFLVAILLISISFMSLIPKIDLNNFKPFLGSGMINILTGALIYFLYTTIPLFYLKIIPDGAIATKDHTKKYILISYLITSFIILLSSIMTLGIFGIDLSLKYQYPELNLLKKVAIFGVFERLESILGIHLILSSFMMMSLLACALFILIGSKFSKKKKDITILTIFLIVLYLEKFFL